MTPRERILAVYRGKRPDAVPFMLDLSHWFYSRSGGGADPQDAGAGRGVRPVLREDR